MVDKSDVLALVQLMLHGTKDNILRRVEDSFLVLWVNFVVSWVRVVRIGYKHGVCYIRVYTPISWEKGGPPLRAKESIERTTAHNREQGSPPIFLSVWAAGELSEAVRTSKRNSEALARWRTKWGRSKHERIRIKMERSSSAERWSTKRILWEGYVGVENGSLLSL
jgi:hypothetical protein